MPTQDHSLSLSNTVHKIMLIELAETLERLIKDFHTTTDTVLKENGIIGFIIKGSGEFSVSTKKTAIPRNPRDVDLIVLERMTSTSKWWQQKASSRKEALCQLLDKAARLNGFTCTPCATNELKPRDFVNRHVFGKLKCEASVALSTDWIDHALTHAEQFHLTMREKVLLRKARDEAIGQIISEKVEITLNQPTQDLPPLNLHEEPFTEGIGINAPLVSLLGKLQAVNNTIRSTPKYESSYDACVSATDKLDIYNLCQNMNNGKGLQKVDYEKLEHIIRHGKNYPKRQRLQKLENGFKILRTDGASAITWSGLFSDRDIATVPEPDEEQIKKLHTDLNQAYKVNLIGAHVTMHQAKEIATLVYDLSKRIFGVAKKDSSIVDNVIAERNEVSPIIHH